MRRIITSILDITGLGSIVVGAAQVAGPGVGWIVAGVALLIVAWRQA